MIRHDVIRVSSVKTKKYCIPDYLGHMALWKCRKRGGKAKVVWGGLTSKVRSGIQC